MANQAPKSPPGLDVEYLQGLHVVDSVLWLDAPRRAELCFLSHAHLEAAPGQARRVLTSEATAHLLAAQLPERTTLRSPFHRSFTFGGLDLRLLPAGHLPGSAQLEVTRDGQRLVYTGHVRLDASPLCEPARVLPCDVLIQPADQGAANLRFPPRSETEPALVDWARTALGRGLRPVLFVPPLGLAQEAGWVLARAGLRLRAPRSLQRIFQRVGELVTGLPGVRGQGGRLEPDEVWLRPLTGRGPLRTTGIPGAVTALLGEAALEPQAARRWGVEQVFAWTDRVDRAGLERYARESGARRVILVHGPSEELARDFRRLGLPAEALSVPSQLDLFHPPAGRAVG